MENERDFLEDLLETYRDVKLKYPHCVEAKILERIKLLDASKGKVE